MKRIAIVEDVSLIANRLKNDLERLQYSCVGIAQNLTEAKELITNETPDLVILDIDLHNLENGLDLVPELKKRRIPFVVLTDLKNASTRDSVIKNSPDGYLTKPVSLANLQSTLALVFSKSIVAVEKKSFHFKKPDGFVQLINYDDIVYVKSDKGGREIHFRSGITTQRVVDTETLTSFLELPHTHNFVRVNRSYVINLDYLESYSYSELKMKHLPNTKIPIGKTYQQEIHALLSSK